MKNNSKKGSRNSGRPESNEPDFSSLVPQGDISSVSTFSRLPVLRLLREFEPMIRAAYEREVAPVRLINGKLAGEEWVEEPELAALAEVMVEHFCCALELLRGEKDPAVANWKNKAKWFPRRYYLQDEMPELQWVSEAGAMEEEVPPPGEDEVAMSMRQNRIPKSNVLKIKGMNFGIRMVLLYQYLNAKKSFEIARQVVRCGTSVGANIHEANAAESLRDFIHKLAISHKELEETIYWLRILKHGNYLPRGGYRSLRNDADELLRLLSRILFKSRMKLKGMS
jgi:four helix bundle protein